MQQCNISKKIVIEISRLKEISSFKGTFIYYEAFRLKMTVIGVRQVHRCGDID